MVDVIKTDYYEIKAEIEDQIVKVYNDTEVNDLVGYADLQCYVYDVKETYTDFQVKITLYSGKVDIRANPGKSIEYDNFQIIREGEHDTILDIHKYGRSNMWGAPTGDYSVCVKGTLTSTYTIKFIEFYQDRERKII